MIVQIQRCVKSRDGVRFESDIWEHVVLNIYIHGRKIHVVFEAFQRAKSASLIFDYDFFKKQQMADLCHH